MSDVRTSNTKLVAVCRQITAAATDMKNWTNFLSVPRQLIGELREALYEIEHPARPRAFTHGLTLSPEDIADIAGLPSETPASPLACEGCGTIGDGIRRCCPDQKMVDAQTVLRRVWDLAYPWPPGASMKAVNCREAGPGKGLCVECAQGYYERCLYVGREVKALCEHGNGPTCGECASLKAGEQP